ncbi:hypothetical protein GCM10029964_084470 [Kibdelosporangium lantanae]
MHVDLNLLVALDALLEENSVAAAADRLRLSAPAMSRTLARIRRATGDDILVRTGRTMTPTPRALALRDETRDLVNRARTVLTPVRTLDLDTLDRTFTLRCHDALVTAFAPALTTLIERDAPNVRVRFLAEPAGDVTDLARGHTDLEIGATRPARPEIAAEVVGDDRMVVVVRADHPWPTVTSPWNAWPGPATSPCPGAAGCTACSTRSLPRKACADACWRRCRRPRQRSNSSPGRTW